MFGYPTPVMVLTFGALAAWGLALWWAYKQPKHRWYHVWMLGLVTMFWWLGESIAIRLGKYDYPAFPLRLPLPWGGTPKKHTWLDDGLRAKIRAGVPIPEDLNAACVAGSWDIPLPVVALEAALLFGFFRLAVRLLKSEKGSRVRAALATGGLCAVLMVNVFAVLDPVVSTTVWCEPSMADPHARHLSYGLWRWFTTKTHQGYWFGVPLVNYAAWFLAAAAFAFVARLDDERPSGLIRKHRTLALYALATIAITSLYFALLIPIKIVIDRALVHGQEYLFAPHPIFSPRLWQFGVVSVLLGLGLLAAYRGKRHARAELDRISVVPKLVTFLFCFGALALQPHRGLWIVWALTAAIAAIALLWPQLVSLWQYILRVWPRLLNRIFGPTDEPPTPPGEARGGDDALGV